MAPHRPHFLIVTYPVQSHINPSLHLAHRLISAAAATVTFSTSASAHLLMFPGATPPVHRGDLTFIPYPDGGPDRSDPDAESPSVSGLDSILTDLAARGRQVTCVIRTLLLTWASDVARRHGIPSVLFWIQPATALAAYYRYFHGYEDVIKPHINDPRFSVKLPGLPPLEIRDLPSFLATDSSGGPFSMILPYFRQSFENIDETKCMILVNTFDELEPEALASVDELELITIGPILPENSTKTAEHGDLFKPADEKGYTDWLDGKAEGSVVYVSFGSISVLRKQQMQEILKGLRLSGRPYLWVVRKECMYEELELDDERGMVVEWCSQMRVLRHPAVGCFVTHCGWNSTAESLLCGVPSVGVPQWSDQTTNAMLVERVWGCGVRGGVDEEGVLKGEELVRCLDLVLGEGVEGREIRRNAQYWKEKTAEVGGDGGSSHRNLKAFVERLLERTGNR